MEASHKKVEHHLKKALEEIRPSASRSRSGSPVRTPIVKAPRKKKEPKETVATQPVKAPRKLKEKPAKIHVCREKKSGLYKKCDTPKKK